MKVIALILFSALANAISAEELPSLERLSADSFKEREVAQKEIAGWILANHEGAKDRLLQKFLKCASPEIRARMVPLLERAYFEPKGYVGVVMMPYGNGQLRGLPRGGPQKEVVGTGVQITQVLPGTPAEASGLKLNDIILKINDWEVRGGYDLTSKVAAEIQRHPPQTPIALDVKRGEEMIGIKLKLGILPVPSERERELLGSRLNGISYVPEELTKQVEEFRLWLAAEIEKERKKLIADRRL
ncbi:MAG: C-terminal processing protease CtpA/Prc [Akkermansiaceae bacterium]|jgi:C-terminal processing protease CtpA/Prc